MNKTLLLALYATAALGLTLSVGTNASVEMEPQGSADTPLGVGQQVAGAWLAVVDFGNGPFEGEMQFFADGNAMLNNTVIQEGSTHLTTALGAWKRTGLQTLSFTDLIRIVDPNGELVSYEKFIGEVTLEGDSFIGEAAGLIYLPGMNPLDPTVDPVFVYGPSEIVGQRIGVHPLSE
jgi:hypothetical protein